MLFHIHKISPPGGDLVENYNLQICALCSRHDSTPSLRLSLTEGMKASNLAYLLLTLILYTVVVSQNTILLLL